jgi:hypothetical protein
MSSPLKRSVALTTISVKQHKTLKRDSMTRLIEAEKKLVGSALIEASWMTYTKSGRDSLANFHCENPGKCAMGVLLVGVGYSFDELDAMDGNPDTWDDVDFVHLWNGYGLAPVNIRNIITANDMGEGSLLRRQFVLQEIKNLKFFPEFFHAIRTLQEFPDVGFDLGSIE